ncbi:fungal-specific transcription factor domain-containing protein [Aspergillus egyptiacus]|nr:fungal-specific transcription factor domain-containing protein [Aspergillus egyptiacus]
MQHAAQDFGERPVWRMQDIRPATHGDAKSGNSHDFRISRRKPLACELCYKRKIKCEFEGSNETCVQCMRRNLSCKTTSPAGTRDDHKRSRYVKSLEERLKRTESLLRAAGILVGPTDRDDSSDLSDDYAGDASPDQGSDKPNGDDAHRTAYGASPERGSPALDITKQPYDFTMLPRAYERGSSNTGKGEPPVYRPDKVNSLYFGRSTPLSILTREGIEWIKNRSGEENSLDTLLSNSKFDSPWAYWRPDVYYDLFSSKVFKPLPPRGEVFSLLGDYFRTMNVIFPLYHEETFMKLVEWQYTQQTCDDAARWASINIILALAYEYRFSNNQKSERDREKAWLYYKNALSVFPELVLRRTDLLSVQALLGMALFLQGNSGSQTSLPIVTAALRSSHRMGLHRDIPRSYLPKSEQEQRKKVFWIAFILDQSISIRLGNAPIQHFDDFDIGLPSDEAVEELRFTDDKPFFPQVCRIAVIRSRIYNLFYSARALENKSTADICELVHKLHAELQEWKGSSRVDTLFKQRGTGEDFLAGLASAGLFLIYYNSLIMIHRIPLWINSLYQSRAESVPELDLRLMLNQSSSSATVCVQAARDTLKLVNNLPWGDIAWIWSLLYYVFLAVMTVFTNILRNSQQPNTKDDLQSLNMAATFFATLIPADGPCNYARFMTRMSTTFERIARTVLERDQKLVRPAEPKRKASRSRATTHAPHAPSQSQPATSPTNSASTDINIPNLEGLPPINSAGYVVMESPSPSPSQSPTVTTSDQQDITIQGSVSSPPPPTDLPGMYQSQSQPQPQPQPQPYPPETTNIRFPAPALSEASFTFPQPELWQIPLTADWEFGFGGHVLGGLFGHGSGNGSHGQGFLFQEGNNISNVSEAMGTPAVPVSLPLSSVSMAERIAAAEYGYAAPNANPNADGNGRGVGNGNGNGNRGQSSGNAIFQCTAPSNATMWMGGTYGNPF